MKRMYKILVVDDSPFMIQQIRKEIEKTDMEHVIMVATGSEDAKRKLHLIHPDVLISDIILEDGQGLNLVQHAANTELPTKCLVLTHCTHEAFQKQAKESGACMVVDKGFEMLQLGKIVQQMVQPILN
ncbi:MAG: response regulator [Hydrotalea sp.]|nr:response regulator [Hydrotalea sp.]